MDANYRAELLSLAGEWCKATGKSLATLGNHILNDAKFFKRIKEGKGCTVDTYLLVKEWLHTNIPKKTLTGLNGVNK